MTNLDLRVDPDSALPLQAQLSDQLAWLIASGRLSEGDLLPPVRRLAQELGINFNTVRAAYKQLEADGLVSARRGQGTTVRAYSRQDALDRRPNLRSFTIGVIIPAHIVFYLPFLNALEVASTDPSLLFVCNAQQNRANGLKYLDQLVAKNVDGILVVSTMVPADVDLGGPGFPPIVFADFPGAPGPTVTFDHLKGSRLATEHILAHGHRRIGFLAPPRELTNVEPKYEGYESALREFRDPVPVGPIETSTDFSIDSAHVSATRMLSDPDRPTAIVAASDNHAIGVMRAANGLGIAIPDDLALIGNDNIMLADLLHPSLTSINVPVAEMGAHAMAMLERLIAGEQLDATHVTLEPELVIRQSCGCSHPET